MTHLYLDSQLNTTHPSLSKNISSLRFAYQSSERRGEKWGGGLVGSENGTWATIKIIVNCIFMVDGITGHQSVLWSVLKRSLLASIVIISQTRYDVTGCPSIKASMPL